MPAELAEKPRTRFGQLRTPDSNNARMVADRMRELNIEIVDGRLTRDPDRIVESPRFMEQVRALKKLHQRLREAQKRSR